MPEVTADFGFDAWDEDVILEEANARLVRTLVRKRFSGGFEGTSVAHLTMAHVDDGPRAYTGFERVTATLDERAGTFLLHHDARSADGEATLRLTVVPDSGTDDLAGIRGEAAIDGGDDGHALRLTYELPAAT